MDGVLYWDSRGTVASSSDVRNCVAFLGRKHNGEEKIVATAFFVSIKVEHLFFAYLVTAAHVIRNTESRDYSDDQIIYLHLNAKSGTRFKPIQSRIKNWYFHPRDDAVDVAVMPFRILPESDHTALDFESSPEIEANPQRWWFDIGTDVFITGLFLRHAGRQRNIPILRTGTIAAMPEEPVTLVKPNGEEQDVRAYLIETHSIGGLSGSPVFANPINVESEYAFTNLRARHIWIGLVSGHWDFDPDGTQEQQINSGIAIVSPRESVWDVLQHPRLIEMREREVKQKRKRDAPTLDDASKPTQKTHAPKPEDRISIPIPTRGQFERDLAKAVRKRDKK